MSPDWNSYTKEELLELYRSIYLPRAIEEKMLNMLRQGQVSKWFSGIGQEAISVGVTLALEKEDFILPLHRNLGVFTTRGVSFKELMLQWKGYQEGFTKGRDRSFHFGSIPHHIVGMISHLAAMLPVADGIALGQKLKRSKNITVAFSGDGGTSEGDFHEALNLAAVWDLPVLFVIENNGYGLSTPSSEQFRCANLADKGSGYGIEALKIDGNNFLEVYSTVKRIVSEMRVNPKPFILECETFRIRGHEEASGVKYVPAELIEKWKTKDPIQLFEDVLMQAGINARQLDAIKSEITEEINLQQKSISDAPAIHTDHEIHDVYASSEPLHEVDSVTFEEKRYIDAISEGLYEAMDRYPQLILMGQDIADYGGVFKITDGLLKQFGNERVRNTPISESAPLGAALGLSIMGFKSMVEMQFSDFVTCGFNQIVNNLAKTYYRWGQNADVVIRMPSGTTTSAGPFHSQSTEAWFFHVPGLKLVYPSSPADAKDLLLAAFQDPNPILFFEHKNLYRNLVGEVGNRAKNVPLGKAHFISKGEDITFISYGLGVHWCKEVIENMNLNASLLDLRTLLPWDQEAVREAVGHSGKVMIVHEDNITGGIGAEIAAWISEHCFETLDAPVMRVGSLDTPIPFNSELEAAYLASSQLQEKVKKLMDY